MLTISTDHPLPKSFCKTENITQLHTFPMPCGMNLGELWMIADMGLLARSVIILDKQHKIVYKQIVDNLASEPDYNTIESALKIYLPRRLIKKPPFGGFFIPK